jgi:hypothetical protein
MHIWRREFIVTLGAAWPFETQAQQPGALLNQAERTNDTAGRQRPLQLFEPSLGERRRKAERSTFVGNSGRAPASSALQAHGFEVFCDKIRGAVATSGAQSHG